MCPSNPRGRARGSQSLALQVGKTGKQLMVGGLKIRLVRSQVIQVISTREGCSQQVEACHWTGGSAALFGKEASSGSSSLAEQECIGWVVFLASLGADAGCFCLVFKWPPGLLFDIPPAPTDPDKKINIFASGTQVRARGWDGWGLMGRNP